MGARELYDRYVDEPSELLVGDDDRAVILSALSLAAAVEESEDKTVQYLLAAGNLHRLAICTEAAALLVARSQEIERLKAENEELRGHAEAMHKWIDRVLSWAERGEQDIGGEELGAIIPDGGPIYEAYRAAKGMP